MRQTEVSGSAEESRKREERQFHDAREALRKSDPTRHDEIYTNRRFYLTTDRSGEYLDQLLLDCCNGKAVLDYCCGSGGITNKISQFSERAVGVDISKESVATGLYASDDEGAPDRVSFLVGDAEHLPFGDRTFDVVICSGVLHHLDLSQALTELARVLKDDGVVIAIEALANNPLIQWYRRSTPRLRTAWETDHILSTRDIRATRSHFSRVRVRYFHLFSIVGVLWIGRPGFRLVMRLLNAIDAAVLRLPGVRTLAWQSIFTLQEPRRTGRSE